jgi:hypothetical protein
LIMNGMQEDVTASFLKLISDLWLVGHKEKHEIVVTLASLECLNVGKGS